MSEQLKAVTTKVTELKVSGKSCGGSGYLRRILRAAKDTGADVVEVKVTKGEYQHAVSRAICSEVALFRELSVASFEVTVTVII